MKICPRCESGYPDELTNCPLHGWLLSEILDLRPGMLVRNTYRIVRKLSKSGMSNVYLAQHVLLNELQVLKFLSPDLSRDKDWTQRFLREVRTLRQIHHKNVVKAGNVEPAEDGALFFTMEYVEGPDLLEFYRRAPQPFDVGLALELVHDIAKGLGAAHAAGVVHRDIKPENILIAIEESSIVPKVADFGIVATSGEGRLTAKGNALLTPQFAAPEQWMGMRTADLDGRTDFYALGGLLFELLTGTSAFKADNYQDWAQQHLNALVPRPSELRPELQNWRGLDELVHRLLAKNPADRPADSVELLHMIKSVKYVAGEQRPPHEEQHAANSQERVEPPSIPGLLVDAACEGSLPKQRVRLTTEPLKSWDAVAPRPALLPRKRHSRQNRKARVRNWFIAAAVLAALTSAAWNLLTRSVNVRILGGQDAVLAVAFAPNGIDLASASRKDTIQFWNVPDGRALGTIAASATSLAFSPDGHAIATGMPDDSINIWDTSRNSVLETLLGHSETVASVTFSPDGHGLATAGWDKTVRLWDVSTGKLLHTFTGHTDRVLAVAYSPDGQTLASAGADQAIRIWSLSEGRLVRTLQAHTQAVNSLAFSPDGHSLASASDDFTIKLWNVTTGQPVHTLKGHTGAVLAVSFSPTGRLLASGGADATVRLWDVGTGSQLRVLKGHTLPVLTTSFSPLGTIVASGSADKTIRLWDVAGVHE
jgi:serine/threonine protein kinase